MTMTMTIGTLAEAAEVSIATVRYYERRGILAVPPRSAAGYRQYDERAVDRVRFVRRAQALGFSLEEIEELLSLRVRDRRSCAAVEVATRGKLASVESKLLELRRLRDVLEGLAKACQERRTTGECPVLAMLEEGGGIDDG